MADPNERRRKKAYDQARSKTRVNLGSAFQRWRGLKEREGLRWDTEVAFFLLDKSKTRVSVGTAFDRWRALKEQKGLKTDAQLARFLLDR
ncbi:zinc finger and SCAN domain-containing protein 12-like isoform X3, partial [Tachysurus ichikawai]